MSTVSDHPDHFYSSFVRRLELSIGSTLPECEVEELLNGAAADEAYVKIPRAIRSGDGIFFSSKALSTEAAALAKGVIEAGAKIFDPACGAGDLLLGAARLLPLEDTFEKTIQSWGKRIGGSDLHQSFINSTKLRLVLLAKLRHGVLEKSITVEKDQLFPLITKQDYLANPDVSNGFECLLTNPPFGHRQAPVGCQWSSGKTQLAAIFMEKVLQSRKPGHVTVAILPDVLRGGSRYGRWRDWLSKQTTVTATQIFGRFEKRTDVDVFLCRFEKLNPPNSQSPSSGAAITKTQTVQEMFYVKVGSVIPHRHPEEGAIRPYLTVGNAPANSEAFVTEHRRFSGTVVSAPFVAIRRTSNPADNQRIVCTVIDGTEEIAVENHLIVAAPHSKNINDCRKLVKLLSSKETTEYINNALRCRHLTTGSVKSIPVKNWSAI